MRIRCYKGAGVMLFRYNSKSGQFEVLLGKRSVPHGYGKWAIPGGRLEEFDANFEDCATREFREETGIDLKNLLTRKMAVRCIDVPLYHWKTIMVLTWGYFPEFKPSEFSELSWFPISTVSKQNLWIKLNRELKAFNKLVKKHELIIAHQTGMPFKDRNLLTAYRHLTHMKLRNPDDIMSSLFRHMYVSKNEIERLSHELERYYVEETI